MSCLNRNTRSCWKLEAELLAPDTTSPTSLLMEATVPANGAVSSVAATAC